MDSHTESQQPQSGATKKEFGCGSYFDGCTRKGLGFFLADSCTKVLKDSQAMLVLDVGFFNLFICLVECQYKGSV